MSQSAQQIQATGIQQCLTVEAILRYQAQLNPDAPAILSPGAAPLRYGDLLLDQQAAVGFLRSLGLSVTDRVALITSNGAAAATSFLYIASACACAPLNPAYKAEELEFYLRDLKARCVVTSHPPGSAAHIAAERLELPVVNLLSEGSSCRFACDAAFPSTESVSSSEVGPVPDETTEDQLALLLHTSGTTSRPKLVPLSQRNLCASAGNIAATLALTPEDRCLNIMPLFHIHGLVAAVLATVHAGGSVVCTDGLYGSGFFEWLEEFAPSWYTAVPTMHMGILSKAAAHAAVIAARPLRFIRSSSSALSPQVLHELEATFHAPVVEAYGMTEASHQMACNPLPPAQRKPGSVGPQAGPDVAIMDAAGNLVDRGETGEVVIRGPNVTSGYLENPEANASAFTNGWFRTGDQGWLDPDGYLYLTGRLKELINRGGEKISPREIDEVFLDHPEVKQALTFAVPHAQLGEEIAVAVVLSPEATVGAPGLREFAARRLAAFKVPRLIRILPEIPKGPTGKPQRIGLAAKLGIEAFDFDRPVAEFQAPTSPLEEQICAIWREMLQRERIGTLDSFSSHGGDSLLAARMLAAVAESTGANLPFASFLDEGTVESIVRDIEAHRATPVDGQPSKQDPIVPLRPNGTRVPLVCVPGHDGVLLGLAQLARLLPEDRPVFALEAPQQAAFPDDRWTVKDFASLYADAIVERFGRQPIHLTGLCFGGVTAYEVARQLALRRAEVASLTLMDALQPQWRRGHGPFSRALAKGAMYFERTKAHLGTLARMPPGEAIAYLRTRASVFFRYRRDAARLNQISGKAAAPVGRPCQADVAIRRRLAVARYQPEPYSGPVAIIRVRGLRPVVPMLGWSGFLNADVSLFEIDFCPRGMFAEPAVREVADILAAILQK